MLKVIWEAFGIFFRYLDLLECFQGLGKGCPNKRLHGVLGNALCDPYGSGIVIRFTKVARQSVG